jgi:hypothetical protein
VEAAPLGIFKAIRTRDAVAQTRDGWPYFQANFQGLGPGGEPVYEIRFGDGEWMLAAAEDLIPNVS